MRVLITGACGLIGSLLSERLAARHEIRGLDIVPGASDYPGEFVLGDCADPAVADAAVAGSDAVVHLAGIATEAELHAILQGHVVGTAALLDAMVQQDVRRMVFASSNHAVGMTPRPTSGSVGVDTPPRPDSFYGVGKVTGEALLSLYADRHGISSVALRIGSCEETPAVRRHLATWLSYDDCEAMVEAALTAGFDGVRPVYGISANRDAWWDLEPGRAIGYHPQDDAAAFEADLPTRDEDEAENARIGGPFALPDFGRRPFSPDP